MNSNQESKHAQILSAATERFGRDGFRATRWADIAGDVGVGPTALYHYFESKQHCLYVIMDRAIADFRHRFAELTAARPDHLAALVAVLEDCFAVSDREVFCLRMLVAEQGVLAARRTPPAEEEARQSARARARDLEFAWAGFLARVMEQGAIQERDPRLLARAILGLFNSVWQWYRPRGPLELEQVADFYIDRALALLGVPPGDVRALRLAA